MLLIILRLIALSTAAQIYDCDGTITNRPCNGGEVVMEERHRPTPSPEEIERRLKTRWKHSLVMARERLRNDFGLEVSLEVPLDICEHRSLDECRTAVSEKESEMNSLLSAALAAKKQEPGEDGARSGSASQGPVAITIIENDEYVLPPVIISPPRPPHRPAPPPPPARPPRKPRPGGGGVGGAGR